MEKQRKVAAIVLAAGSGKRMHSSVKKQYMELLGYPVIYYSLLAFEKYGIDQIVLVTGAEDIEYCQEHIVKRYGFQKVNQIIAGGKERYHSVMEGLKAVKDADYVLIHDGARPCLTPAVIARCIQDARQYGACVAAVPSKDTIKIADEEGFAAQTPPRSLVYLIQTPQAFSMELIQRAYETMQQSDLTGITITDDAMVVERFTNERVKLTEGDYENIKVTTPEDLSTAEMFLRSRSIP